jgi:hypothetical protein
MIVDDLLIIVRSLITVNAWLEFRPDAFPKRAQASRGAGAQASDAAPEQNLLVSRHQPKIFAKQKTEPMFLKSFRPLVTLRESHSGFVSPRLLHHPPLEYRAGRLLMTAGGDVRSRG